MTLAELPLAADPSHAWSQHWQQTLTGSIDLLASDPVATALRTHWQSQIPALQLAGAIADVGSGPAILARLMSSLGWTPAPPAVWWCIDAAHLGSAWQHALPASIRVLDQTPFDTAEPPHGPVDALVSNFGLEYLPLRSIAQAVPRWLRPNGIFNAVLHARGSVIDAVSREHAGDLRMALEDVRLPALAKDLVSALATAPADPVQRMMHGVETRDAYNAGVDRLKQVMEDRGRPSAVLMDLLRATTQVIRDLKTVGEPAAQRTLEQLQAVYEGERRRLDQMLASALDETAAAHWRTTLQESAGLKHLELERLDCGIGTVAWNLRSAA